MQALTRKQTAGWHSMRTCPSALPGLQCKLLASCMCCMQGQQPERQDSGAEELESRGAALEQQQAALQAERDSLATEVSRHYPGNADMMSLCLCPGFSIRKCTWH